jgi:hypothetical protein
LADLFEEVEEQLRSDRYRVLARKALPWVLAALAAALVIALAVWGWQQYRQQASDKASEQYTQALEALSTGDQVKATQLWGEVAKSPAKSYAALAMMQLGGLKLIAARDTKAAVALFDQAAQTAPDAVLGDAARLKSAFAVLDTASYSDMEARLTPLMKEGAPYAIEAREGLAFAKLMAGNTAGARNDFVVISQSLGAQEGARQRAKAAINLIDSGSAKSVAAVARAAIALPPPTMPGAMAPASQPQTQGPSPQ